MDTEFLQTLETIMRYYVWAVVLMTPFTLLLMIYLYKKTHFFEAIDSIIDKILKIDPKEKKSNKDASGKEQKKSEKENSSKKKPEEENENDIIEKLKENLTIINLKVGDSYKCVPNSMEKKRIGSNRNWKIDNEFIGKIESSTGVFKAEKIGWGIVECNDEMLYFIEVLPKISNWEFDDMYRDVISPSDISTIRLRYMRKMFVPTSYNLKNFKSVFAQPVIGGRKCTCIFDQTKNVIKCVIELPYSAEMMNTITEGMKERMDLISKQESPEKFWISLGRDDSSEDVMFIGFLQKKKSSERYLFGIGISWKECDKDEVLSNPGMITRFFADCLDKEDLPDSVNTTSETKKETENKSASKNSDKKENPADKSNESSAGNTPSESKPEETANENSTATNGGQDNIQKNEDSSEQPVPDEKESSSSSDSNPAEETQDNDTNPDYEENDPFNTGMYNEGNSDYSSEDEEEKETLEL